MSSYLRKVGEDVIKRTDECRQLASTISEAAATGGLDEAMRQQWLTAYDRLKQKANQFFLLKEKLPEGGGDVELPLSRATLEMVWLDMQRSVNVAFQSLVKANQLISSIEEDKLKQQSQPQPSQQPQPEKPRFDGRGRIQVGDSKGSSSSPRASTSSSSQPQQQREERGGKVGGKTVYRTEKFAEEAAVEVSEKPRGGATRTAKTAAGPKQPSLRGSQRRQARGNDHHYGADGYDNATKRRQQQEDEEDTAASDEEGSGVDDSDSFWDSTASSGTEDEEEDEGEQEYDEDEEEQEQEVRHPEPCNRPKDRELACSLKYPPQQEPGPRQQRSQSIATTTVFSTRALKPSGAAQSNSNPDELEPKDKTKMFSTELEYQSHSNGGGDSFLKLSFSKGKSPSFVHLGYLNRLEKKGLKKKWVTRYFTLDFSSLKVYKATDALGEDGVASSAWPIDEYRLYDLEEICFKQNIHKTEYCTKISFQTGNIYLHSKHRNVMIKWMLCVDTAANRKRVQSSSYISKLRGRPTLMQEMYLYQFSEAVISGNSKGQSYEWHYLRKATDGYGIIKRIQNEEGAEPISFSWDGEHVQQLSGSPGGHGSWDGVWFNWYVPGTKSEIFMRYQWHAKLQEFHHVASSPSSAVLPPTHASPSSALLPRFKFVGKDVLSSDGQHNWSVAGRRVPPPLVMAVQLYLLYRDLSTKRAL
ncbi:hypothetical protein QOT17_007511 [Balamuthia mandrillaris]